MVFYQGRIGSLILRLSTSLVLLGGTRFASAVGTWSVIATSDPGPGQVCRPAAVACRRLCLPPGCVSWARPIWFDPTEQVWQAGPMRVLRTAEERFADVPGFPYPPRYADVTDGLRMAFVEAGPADGEPILLLHGEPT